MKRAIFTALLLASAPANAATLEIGGRFFPSFTEGYVDAIAHNYAVSDDTGLTYGTPVDFSAPAIFPWPIDVAIDTPNYGVVTADFYSLASWVITPDGSFWTLYGTIDGTGWGEISVNLVNPGEGISSFSIGGNFTYNPPSVESPPCLNCDPPPPPIVGAPEPSTWLMMAIGFIALGYAAMRRRMA